MNQTTTYEQLIAAKLQDLSAPAKIDAIWARIEQQLDVEMPNDESGPSDTGASSTPGFYFPGSKFLYVFLAAVAGVYLLTRPYAIQNHAAETDLQNRYKITDTVSAEKNADKESNNEIIFTDKADKPVEETVVPSDSMPVSSPPISTDNTIKEPELITQLPVSNTINEVKKQPVTVTTTDTTPKKGRGVKGLNINDYKIAPVKKDNQP